MGFFVCLFVYLGHFSFCCWCSFTCFSFPNIMHCLSSPSDSDLPHHRPKPLYVPVSRNNESTFCTRDQYLAPRVAFITWLVNFFLEKKYVSSATTSTKNGGEVLPKIIQVDAGRSKRFSCSVKCLFRGKPLCCSLQPW